MGKTIARVHLNNPPATTIEISPSLRSTSFPLVLKGKRIENISRRGKNILLELSGNLILWVHLKMTGHFFFQQRKVPAAKHDLVLIDFFNSNGSRKLHPMNLRFNDYRRFGRLRLLNKQELLEHKGFKNLGPEPLEISSVDFVNLCLNRNRMIKPALLDQTFLAGIGNIYADESLHDSRIHPQRLLSSLSKKKLTELHGHIQRILVSAIAKMGSSVDSFSGVNARPGQFQKYLKVYGKENKPCQRCGKPIVRKKIGSRSAHFCPKCQRL